MRGESEIRVARLAIARYGLDPKQVQRSLHVVLAAQARGEPLDLLEVLTRDKLLARKHADDLRFGLDQTQLDLTAVPPPAGKKPAPARADEAPFLLNPFGDLKQLGDYRVLRRLGAGGMGAVFLGYDPNHRRNVALKVLAPDQAAAPNTLDRFEREARSGLALNHPNIVRLFAADRDPATGLHYLVLEYVDGPSAHDLLEQHGRLAVGDAVCLALDVARALEYAHGKSIVHRDIKPANVLLTQSGVAKLSDLGLAKHLDETKHLTHTRQGIGTPYYMPYEQALSAKQVDARSDLYALGATLYHLVVGDVPFPGKNALEIMDCKELGVFLPARCVNPEVPEALDRILARLLALRPADRYQTASELIVELERTGLAVAVPSNANAEQARADPQAIRRLAAVPPTCPDLRLAERAGNVWYLLYRRAGKLCRAKLTTQQIVQRLRRGKLSPQLRASRSPRRGFKPIARYAEFQDALRPTPPTPPRPAVAERVPSPTAPANWGWVLAATLCVGILVLVSLVVYLT